jgi:hypothetical protein
MSLRKIVVGAVLTGDIVNSTKLIPEKEKDIIERLTNTLLKDYLYEFYRGDSFQIFVERPEHALSLALACRTLAIQFTEKTEMDFDMRISIGIGEVSLPLQHLGTAKGAAFLLSGREFDTLKEKGRRLIMVSGDRKADIGFEVMSDYLDSIFKKMTAKQADVIFELLQGVNQQQLAVTLDKSKSTISQLASDGRWPEIERLLQQYKLLINELL